MKKLALASILAIVAAPAAFASADLAQKKNCLACHQTDKKLVGPSYKEVAAKYAGQKDAACSSIGELATRFPSAPAHIQTRAQSERARLGC